MKTIWNYEDGDVDGLSTAISDIPFDEILDTSADIHEAAEVWTNLIHGDGAGVHPLQNCEGVPERQAMDKQRRKITNQEEKSALQKI